MGGEGRKGREMGSGSGRGKGREWKWEGKAGERGGKWEGKGEGMGNGNGRGRGQALRGNGAGKGQEKGREWGRRRQVKGREKRREGKGKTREREGQGTGRKGKGRGRAHSRSRTAVTLLGCPWSSACAGPDTDTRVSQQPLCSSCSGYDGHSDLHVGITNSQGNQHPAGATPAALGIPARNIPAWGHWEWSHLAAELQSKSIPLNGLSRCLPPLE